MTDIKIYWSNSQLWYIAENADGTVIANYNRNLKPYSRVPYNNVASAVKSAGGLNAFKARLISLDEAEARLTAEAVAKAERDAQKAVDAAKEKAAATAVFDTPILINGQLTTRVCLGAPRGHLEKYTRI